MIKIHNLGYPRIGANRELKWALEAYWRGDIDLMELQHTAQQLRAEHWQQQRNAGLDWIPVGDFSLYDQVLDMSCLLGAIPARFVTEQDRVDLDTYFAMARGRQSEQQTLAACEMTKWFNTNYHYLAPEISRDQSFRIASDKLFDDVKASRALGVPGRPVILGPLSWLWLARVKGGSFDKLDLLPALLTVYGQILGRLQALEVSWVQIDEPILALDLPQAWQNAFESAYNRLHVRGLNSLLTCYFGALGDNLDLACRLPVDGLHIDLVESGEEWQQVTDRLAPYKVLSLGVIDGRNIWRSDLDRILQRIEQVTRVFNGEVWLAPSCSLLHVPVDLDNETELDDEMRGWLAFARQKLDELALLKTALNTPDDSTRNQLRNAAGKVAQRKQSPRIHDAAVAQRMAVIDNTMTRRHSAYSQRHRVQQGRYGLPLLPTTTIGSFPQTEVIRSARRRFRQGELSAEDYAQAMRDEIALAIQRQDALGLDVLVHGEAERNDMVEYFGSLLQGFAFTRQGWVQSYGSRCVKPPIIYGDVSRPQPMTIDWILYAQSLTDKPVKGMLTGPVTMLNWSFVRDDQSQATTARQIALALRDEVTDLEAAGIGIIQIDEAALREGMPLRQRDWSGYLQWAVEAFRITSAGVADETQIHTHMCYSEFNDIIAAIAEMDADVVTIEAVRSDMRLLEAFEDFDYPNEIGPGVYDIHSPNVPEQQVMIDLLEKAAAKIPLQRLWVNPDCGLKTRQWPEVEAALSRMVAAADVVRNRHRQVGSAS